MKIVNPKEPFKYVSGKIPKSYRCSKCKTHGVKLWREWNTFLDHQQLYCCICAGINQNKQSEVALITYQGKVKDNLIGSEMLTDIIGSLCPAVPTEDNDTFWGYSSVPAAGASWWRGLPNFPLKPLDGKTQKEQVKILKDLLREIQVEYMNSRIDLHFNIRAKITNTLGPSK